MDWFLLILKTILVLFILLSLIILEVIIRRSINRVKISNALKKISPPFYLRFKSNLNNTIFLDDHFWKLFLNFGKQVPSNIRKINVKETLNKSISSWDNMNFVEEELKVSPRYIVLLEFNSSRNFLLKSFELFFNLLRLNDLNVDVFRYYQSIDNLYMGKKKVSLKSILPLSRYEKVILISSLDQFVNQFKGTVEDSFLEKFDPNNTFIISSKRVIEWTSIEKIFSLKYKLFPSSIEGLIFLSENLDVTSAFNKSDFANHLISSTTVLDFDSPNEEKDFISELKESLTKEQYLWVVSLAIHYDLNWDLFLQLGKKSFEFFGHKSFTIIDLIKVANLDWTRKGYIPDNFRLTLLKSIPRHRFIDMRKSFLNILRLPPPNSLASKKYYINVLINKSLTNTKYFSIKRIKVKSKLLKEYDSRVFPDRAILKIAGIVPRFGDLVLPESLANKIIDSPWLNAKFRIYYLITTFVFAGYFFNLYTIYPYLYRVALIFSLLSFIPASILLIKSHAKQKESISGLTLASILIFFNLLFGFIVTIFISLFDTDIYLRIENYYFQNRKFSLFDFRSVKSFSVSTVISFSITVSTFLIILIRKEYIKPLEGTLYVLFTWLLLSNVLAVYLGLHWLIVLIIVILFIRHALNSFY